MNLTMKMEILVLDNGDDDLNKVDNIFAKLLFMEDVEDLLKIPSYQRKVSPNKLL